MAKDAHPPTLASRTLRERFDFSIGDLAAWRTR
jgi:hypothetical protein